MDLTCLMSDIGSSWDEETVALLLGARKDRIGVEFIHRDDTDGGSSDNTKTAKLSFASRDAMRNTVIAYRGLVIPMTHGYHHYSFSDGSDAGDDRAADAVSVTPPLHLQLMALPTKELERRLSLLGGDASSADHSKSKGGNRTCKVHKHASLAFHLAQALGGSRPTTACLGVPVPSGSTDDLLEYLRSSTDKLWPPQDKQRKGVNSVNYLTVRKQHPPEHDKIWELCEKLIRKVIPEAAYNSLAVTRGFLGSPHVDNHDKTFQHVIALGDFEGGHLCAEADEGGREVVAVDVKCRFGRIDGRAVHWVSGWTGERYSIVYYSTSDDDWTERVSQTVHTKWMREASKVPQKSYALNNSRLPNNTPILGLGCSSFSTFFSAEDGESLTVDTIYRDHAAVKGWIETIRHAVLNRGINLLDTAPWYGHGTSEITVGYALNTILQDDVDEKLHGEKSLSESARIRRRKRTGSVPRSQLIINTKVGRYESDPLHQFDFSYDTTMHSVRRSLERMNCTFIDVIQLHDPEFAPSMSILINETVPALLECRKNGWAKAIGLTGYPLEVQHQILVECHEKYGDGVVFDQALVYCHNNLHDMSLFCVDCFPLLEKSVQREENDGKKARVVSYAQFCQQSNIHLMAAAPLSMGLLTTSGPPAWHPAPNSLKLACSNAASICSSKGVNISDLAVLYSLSQREVGCTLLGMKNVQEVDVAADLALRFHNLDMAENDTDEQNQHSQSKLNSALDQILSTREKEVFALLLDQKDGPFATVTSNGEYRWDGKEEAKKFWALVDELRNDRD